MLAKSQLHELYHWLLLTRTIEDRIASLYRTGKIFGHVYTSRGQEAVSVGAAYAMERDDIVAPMLRDLGALLVRGFTAREVLCQYMGRGCGPTGGRDSGIFMGSLKRGVIAPLAVLGTMVPVVAGIALAAKMQKQGTVALTFLGDGAAGTSDFHEGLNFAAVRKVPMVLVLENNGWALSTPASAHAANADFLTRARAYGVVGHEVDGDAVLDVHRVAHAAIEEARDGKGPVLIVANMIRARPDPGFDAAWSVPKSMADRRKGPDSIRQFEEHLIEGGLMTSAERSEMVARVRAVVDEATDDAQGSPYAPGRRALGGVYHEA